MTEGIHNFAVQWKYIYIITSLVDRSVTVFHNFGSSGFQTSTPYIFICGGTWKSWSASKMLKYKVHFCYILGAAMYVKENPNDMMRATHLIHRYARMCTDVRAIILNIYCKFDNKIFI
jgi:hypothetical protein